MYSAGRYFNKNPYRAVTLWREAAELDHIKAMFNLALMYEKGEGVEEQSYLTAFKWYRKAAINENTEAQCYLADMYAEGKGTDKDESAAVEWYEKSANKGFQMAIIGLEKLANNGNTRAKEILENFRKK